MAIEIEAKFRIADPDAIRRRLHADAEPIAKVLERNTYFDTPAGELRAADRGLRVREIESVGGESRCTLTYKGPRRQGPLKIRTEQELGVDSAEAAAALLASLGYEPTVSFQKRRESFRLGPARIELDELPELGFFLEIEADDEPAVQAARESLGLADAPTVTETYPAMVAEHLAHAGQTHLAF